MAYIKWLEMTGTYHTYPDVISSPPKNTLKLCSIWRDIAPIKNCFLRDLLAVTSIPINVNWIHIQRVYISYLIIASLQCLFHFFKIKISNYCVVMLKRSTTFRYLHLSCIENRRTTTIKVRGGKEETKDVFQMLP